MNVEELQKRLAWFHALEINQVELYKAQAELTDSESDKLMFLKISDIEAGHVVNTRDALASIGGSPSLLSKVASASGAALGSVTGQSLEMALRSDIALENRAMQDYVNLIAECTDQRIKDVLWSNLLDEMHLYSPLYEKSQPQ